MVRIDNDDNGDINELLYSITILDHPPYSDSEIFPVPNRDVKLDSENEKRNVEDVAIKYVQNLPLNEDAKERLIDLFIERDKELLTLFHYFHYNRENFSKQAMIFLRNRDLLYEKNNK